MDPRRNLIANSAPQTNAQIDSLVSKLSSIPDAAGLAREIEVVLSCPSILVFGELLEITSVKQLGNTEFAGHLELLKLFAFGTLRDYEERKLHLPALSEPMIQKLRLLTVASLAARSRSLPYSELMTELGFRTRRELEDTIIEAIYSGVVSGRLDQEKASFEVDKVLARDVPENVSSMKELLDNWSLCCENTLRAIERESDRAALQKINYQERVADLDMRLRLMKSSQSEDTDPTSTKYKNRLKA